MPAHKVDIRIRLDAKTDKSGGCWVWKGCKDKNGYGCIQDGGEKRRAHRVVWELHNGPIQSGMVICHSCDNPSCVKPSHLFAGTVADNNLDKLKKSRHSRGAGHGRAKLSESAVRAIREATGYTNREIAVVFGVSASLVGQIRQGLVWRAVA